MAECLDLNNSRRNVRVFVVPPENVFCVLDGLMELGNEGATLRRSASNSIAIQGSLSLQVRRLRGNEGAANAWRPSDPLTFNLLIIEPTTN